jgi:hypothetical protein
MILEQTVTWLEMTSPDQLRPGRPPPEPVELVQAGPSQRVWLHTASADHAHALPNYQARGFRVVRSEVRRKEVPDTDA